jgi:hypothetical protein
MGLSSCASICRVWVNWLAPPVIVLPMALNHILHGEKHIISIIVWLVCVAYNNEDVSVFTINPLSSNGIASSIIRYIIHEFLVDTM